MTIRRTAAALSLSALAALTLTACDSADEALDAGADNEPESNVTVGAEESPDQDGAEESAHQDSGEGEAESTDEASEEASEEPTDASSEEPSQAEQDVENHPVYSGLAAVEAEYPEGVVFEGEDEDSSYQWEVYTEGTVLQVEVDKQSLQIVQTEDEGTPDGEEQAEIDAVGITLEEALRAVEDQAGDPSGAFLDSVDLDTEDGTVVWQIELATGAEIDVDVTTGEIVRQATDD